MPSIRKQEKIGALTNVGNVISLAASVLNVGGQQYTTTSNLTMTASGLTSNGLYMIYAVVESGAVKLVQSANVNSVGPAGYSAWKLVGAFYATWNGSISFGGFVNIEGVPESGLYLMGTTTWTANNIAPTKGTIVFDQFIGQRKGSLFLGEMNYAHSTAGVANSGDYFLAIPFIPNPLPHPHITAAFDSTAWNRETQTAFIGHGHLSIQGTSRGPLYAFAKAPGDTVIMNAHGNMASESSPGSSYYAFSQTNMAFKISFQYHVQGWTNTPLKDL